MSVRVHVCDVCERICMHVCGVSVRVHVCGVCERICMHVCGVSVRVCVFVCVCYLRGTV